MAFFVYILASQRNGTLYIGATHDLVRRVYEHKQDVIAGFSKEHGVHLLVHFEEFDDAVTAIQREKTLKHWVRRWKTDLIERGNPIWRDLYDEIAAN